MVLELRGKQTEADVSFYLTDLLKVMDAIARLCDKKYFKK
jgi:hypothetical protein